MKTAAWVAASGCILLLAGCGLPANPQPPSLWLPQPVKDLTATRVANQVLLRWKMPSHTTDKVELHGRQRAHICWTSGLTPNPADRSVTGHLRNCQTAGDADFPPDKPAEFTAALPVSLIAGPHKAVSYYVELENPAGKTAGPSNPAWVATGNAPSAVVGLHLATRKEGVVLRWQPAPPHPGMVMRIHRALVSQSRTPPPSRPGQPPVAQQQTLEVSLAKTDPGGAVDRHATLDHVWRYQIERVLFVHLDHRTLEIAGQSSPSQTIDARDVFPPAVPSGLAVVPDQQARTMSLSWIPDSATDLAGYIVYRRDLSAGSGIQRISGAALIVAPSFVDSNVVPDHRYAYSVSAVDQDGNQSARSSEVVVELKK